MLLIMWDEVVLLRYAGEYFRLQSFLFICYGKTADTSADEWACLEE